MQRKKDQHYVPKFYLKNFSKNKKSLGMLRRSGFRVVEYASINQIAYRDYMYGKDGFLEEWLSKCERKWSQVIRYFFLGDDSECANPSEYYQLLLHFVIISLARTAKVADSYRLLFDNFKKMFDETEASGGALAFNREEFFADYDIPNNLPIDVANNLLNILSDLKPLTIINESGRGFITSDNPVTLYNPLYARRNYRVNYGLGSGGIVIFLPLSPTICFRLYDLEVYDEKSVDGSNIIIRSKNQINELNRLFTKNAYEAIYWGANVDVDYARRIGKEFQTPKSPVEEWPIKGSPHSIIRFGTESIFKHYQIPYLKIKDKYLSMQLPHHLGGLSRNYAQMVEEEYQRKIDFEWRNS